MAASRCGSISRSSRRGRTTLPASSASRRPQERNREKNMRHTLLASAAVALVMTAPALGQQISGDVVRIGVLTDLSGVYSDFGGPGAVEAAKMAVEDAGGKVNGKNIEVISADHQNKPDVAASKAREWYDTQGVDMIAESLNSAV